jgi:hypothetical protein
VTTRNWQTLNFNLSDHLGSNAIMTDLNGVRTSEVRRNEELRMSGGMLGGWRGGGMAIS